MSIGALVILVLALVVFGVIAWMIKHERADDTFDDKPVPLTFWSLVGAIVIGQLITGVIGALLWVLFLSAS